MRTLVEKEVLASIKPEPLSPDVDRHLDKLRKVLTDADVIIGGSTAKGTHLKGDHDMDVFVRFERTEGMSDILETALNTVFTAVERVHGSRDYFQVPKGRWMFEFVPVKKITSWKEAENVTDVSPLHVTYVKKNLPDRLRDDVRLLKQFCKSAGVYGAESYIGGFSGHVVELLVIEYGGFRDVLTAAVGWKHAVELDPEQHKTTLNPSKTASPLVIIDPVQPERNAAAAVTKESFERFKERAAAYLKASEEEQENYFSIIPLTAEQFQELHPKDEVFEIHISPLDGKRDVVAAKCQKVVEYLTRLLNEHGFTIHGSAWEYGNPARAFFAIPPGQLPEEIVLQGPPETQEDAAAAFRSKHASAVLRDGRWYATRKREFRDPLTLIQRLERNPYVTRRSNGISVAKL